MTDLSLIEIVELRMVAILSVSSCSNVVIASSFIKLVHGPQFDYLEMNNIATFGIVQ
jgi:hypothetical protein